MDEATSKRIEGLTMEVRKLQKEIQELTAQNGMLRGTIHTRDSLINEQSCKIEELTKETAFLKEELSLTERKYKGQLKKVQADARRNDVFREVYKGTTKMKREEFANERIQTLERTNTVLMGFIKEISHRFGFDTDTCIALCEIATGVDDCLIKMFLESILPAGRRTKQASAKTEGGKLLFVNMDEFEKNILSE